MAKGTLESMQAPVSTGISLFVCTLAGGRCGLVATATSASFIVPDVPPQNGALLVSGLIIGPHVSCTVSAGCDVSGSTYGESVAIETHVSPWEGAAHHLNRRLRS